MDKYLFLISWVAFSESAGGEDTGVNSSDDLLEQYRVGNQNVSAYPCDSPEDGIVKAFFGNYTARDSVSLLLENVSEDTLVPV
jgi:hypothetical protein